MIFASQFVTLDGIATDPDVWHPEYTSEESNALLLEEMAAADTQLLGRKTYEGLSGFWPSVPSDVPLSDATNTLPKLAVSTTMQDLAWGDGVERSDIELAPTEVVQHLDQLPRDRTLMLSGSLTLMHGLLACGLLDELHLYVDPVLLGSGRPLFDQAQARLARTRQVELPHGMVYLEYAVERS